MIGANGIVRGEKVTSLARWPPNPDAGPFLWRTIGSGGLPVPVLPNVNLILEDYWARFDGLRLLAPFSNISGELFHISFAFDTSARPTRAM